jgi:hypothetical protein
MKKRSGVVLAGRALGLVWGALVVVAACSKNSSPSGASTDADAGTSADAGCKPGDTEECTFDQLCTGVATCLPSGEGFGPCQCDTVPSDGSGGIVGARCESDTDCLGGALCLRADGDLYAGGGPAGGYCTFACTATGDCTSHDTHSDCETVNSNGGRYCIRTCLSKDAEPGEAKCLNRPDLVCESIAADTGNFTADRQDGFCAPLCGSDEECPAGRFCNRQGHICVAFRAPGAPTGSACSLEADCDGHSCENRVNGIGVCTAACTLGSLSGCGYSREDATRKAACVTAQVAASRFSEGSGDLGFCRELCDVDSDCIQAAHGFGCAPFTDQAAAFFGRAGACAPKSAN